MIDNGTLRSGGRKCKWECCKPRNPLHWRKSVINGGTLMSGGRNCKNVLSLETHCKQLATEEEEEHQSNIKSL